METQRLYEILNQCTMQLRKGAEVEQRTTEGGLQVTEIYAMPHEQEVSGDGIEKVDMELLSVGVIKGLAETHRYELIEILNAYPKHRLKAGPSYIEVGGIIGDQGAAFQLFAMGQVLGFWKVITPTTLGIKSKEKVKELAGLGYVMISGYKPH